MWIEGTKFPVVGLFDPDRDLAPQFGQSALVVVILKKT